MPNELVPLSLASATIALGIDTDGWTLHKIGDDAEEPRDFTTRIPFEFPFGSTPVIHAGLTGFDLDQRDSARLKLLVTHIDPSGFDLTIRTWADTRVYGVDVSWLAMGF